MKKLFLGLSLILMSSTLTSCYNTRIIYGDITAKTPVVNVHSEWNHHFLYGLVPGPNTSIRTKDFLGKEENYVVKTNQTFVNGLISFLTWGLYTPSTTTYYIPLNNLKK